MEAGGLRRWCFPPAQGRGTGSSDCIALDMDIASPNSTFSSQITQHYLVLSGHHVSPRHGTV